MTRLSIIRLLLAHRLIDLVKLLVPEDELERVRRLSPGARVPQRRGSPVTPVPRSGDDSTQWEPSRPSRHLIASPKTVSKEGPHGEADRLEDSGFIA